MINFMERRYGAKASSSHVHQDGYEVENLIVEGPEKSFFSRQNGFLVEHFIKPPVDVNFHFPFSIQISSIELGLSVGAQTTDGIEILVTDDPSVNGIFRVVCHQCPISDKYLKVTNASFKTRPPYHLDAKDSKTSRNGVKLCFKLSHLLNNVKIVKVRIIKTLGSSVPALGSIKVIGIPGISCKQEEAERILQLYRCKPSEPCNDDDDDVVEILPTGCSSGSSRKNGSIKVQVPEEFIDPLTCEIMALPMLLPSGHSVDQSTLDKFSNTQASWGRLPCDPFTGIPFGPDRKAITNAPLKSRIDAFLVKNACLDLQLSCVPRSLGRKPVEFSQNKSNVLASANIAISSASVETDSQSLAPAVLSLGEDYNVDSEMSHEQTLQNSLDVALKMCYGSQSPLQRGDSSTKIDACVVCGKSSTLSRYKLPCKHYLCRNCLLSSQNVCSRCQKPFIREQVHRTYNIP